MANNSSSVYDASSNNRTFFGVPSKTKIICFLVLILFILTLVVIFFSLLGKQTKIRQLEHFAGFESALNSSVDPCFDFYNFTCGLWSKKNQVHNYSPRTTAFSILQDKINLKKKDLINDAFESPDLPVAVNSAIRFYNLCVRSNDKETNDSAALIDYLSQIGGWPILDKSEWDDDRFDWLNATAFYSKTFGVNIVFDISLKSHGNRNFIYIWQPAFSDIGQTILYAILQNIDCPQSVYVTELVTKTNEKWKEYLYDSVNTTNSVSTTVEDLLNQIPEIDWLRYFHIMFQNNLLVYNKTLSLKDTVVIGNMEYLRTVVKVLNSDTFSKLELSNLFGSIFVVEIWILIPGVLKTYSAFYEDDVDTQIDTAKSHCYNFVEELFPCSLDYLYIKSLPSQETESSEILTRYVKIAFQDIVSHSDWLDDESKAVVLNRLEEMKKVIGFPSYLNNKTKFNLSYKDFPVVSRNILESYLKIREYFMHARVWILPRSITHVGAYYNNDENTIVFPISLQNPPFFYKNGPSSLNFGAIGSVIAHEMMHAFHDENYFHSFGFATNSSADTFKNNRHCFVEQYDKYDANGLYKNNGTSTLRENIADSEGLHIAFEAYKKHEADFGHIYQFGNFTSDQMFFISFGTVWCSKYVHGLRVESHSIPELRVNGAVSNLKSFASAFNCPENSAMNPTKRCFIW